MRTYTILLATLLLISCGSEYQTEEEKQKLKDAETEETAAPVGGSDEITSTVNVDVSVEIENTVADYDERRLIYIPKLVTWLDAMQKAPRGFRLLTRFEAVLLFDLGYIDDLGVDELFWTSTTEGTVYAYLLNPENGRTFSYGRDSVRFGSIYIEDTGSEDDHEEA